MIQNLNSSLYNDSVTSPLRLSLRGAKCHFVYIYEVSETRPRCVILLLRTRITLCEASTQYNIFIYVSIIKYNYNMKYYNYYKLLL